MIKVINYALGSKSYFDEEIANHNDRKLVLAENLTTGDSYILLDLSDKPSFFGDSIQLKTVHNVGKDNFDHYFYVQAFDLDKEDHEMLDEVAPDVLDDSIKNFSGKMDCGYYCQRLDHPQTMVMVTTWRSQDDLEHWLNSSAYEPLKPYTNQQLLNFTELFKTVEDK